MGRGTEIHFGRQPTVRLEVLGPPRACGGERTIALTDRRPDEVLAVVGASNQGVVSAAELLDAVWDRLADRRGLDVLKNAVYQLNRRFTGEFGVRPLVAAGAGYRLASAVTVDANRFEMEAARLTRLSFDEPRPQGELEELQRRVRSVLAPWRGEHAFPGLDRPAVVADQARLLRRLRQGVTRVGFECSLALGRHHGIAEDLRAALDDEPYDESLCGLLMTALARCGRRRDALAAYSAFRQGLAEGTGLEPSARLRQLERQLLVDDAVTGWGAPAIAPQRAGAAKGVTTTGPADAWSSLSPRAHLVLKAVAVGGSPFTLEMVSEVVGHEPDAVAAWLDEAISAELVVEATHQHGHYRLVEFDAHNRLLGTIGSTHHRRLHQRWADVNARHRPDDVRRRADHLIAAGPVGVGEQLVDAVGHAVERLAGSVDPLTAAELVEDAIEADRRGSASPHTERLLQLRHEVDRWRCGGDDVAVVSVVGPAVSNETREPDPMPMIEEAMGAGRFDTALALAVGLEDRANGVGTDHDRWWSLVVRSAIARVHARFVDADHLAAQANRLGQRLDPTVADTTYALQLHDSLWWAGTVGTLTDSLAAAATSTAPALAHLMVAQALLTDERSSEAKDIWATWGPSLPNLAPDSRWLPTMVLAADLVTSGIDDEQAAEWLWDSLIPHAGRWVCVGRLVACWGPVDGYLAALALTLGRSDDAGTALRRARDQCARAAAPLWGDRLWPLFNRLAG